MSLRLERLVLLSFLAALAVNLAWCALAIPAWPLLAAGLAMVLARGMVAVAGLAVAQHRLGVIPWGQVRELALAAGLGLALYGGGLGFLPREVAEFLGLAPLFVVMWRWHRGRHRRS
jgi:O-antigen/teichoic acid export membrane protein